MAFRAHGHDHRTHGHRPGDDVWWEDLRGVAAFLVDDAGALILVDAGNPWDGRNLARGLERLGRAVGDVERVPFTHYDFDHLGSLGRLSDLDATVYVGEADAPLVAGLERPPWTDRKGLFQFALSACLTPPDLPVETVANGW
jgi:glyoxylase-like metal-dependent hydrolase (beta-lactamase superfamily II)